MELFVCNKFFNYKETISKCEQSHVLASVARCRYLLVLFLCLWVSLTHWCTYSSVRKLVKLSAVQFMLNNHTVCPCYVIKLFRSTQESPCSCCCVAGVLFLMVSFLGQSEHFSFLGVNNQSNLSDMRCRTTFYTALGRLLMVDLGAFLLVFILVRNYLKT